MPFIQARLTCVLSFLLFHSRLLLRNLLTLKDKEDIIKHSSRNTTECTFMILTMWLLFLVFPFCSTFPSSTCSTFTNTAASVRAVPVWFSAPAGRGGSGGSSVVDTVSGWFRAGGGMCGVGNTSGTDSQ